MKAAVKRWWVIALAALVTVGVRLLSYGASLDLRQALAYDDNAYFGGAQMLVVGRLPYRSFPFVQPPGGVLVGAPFALVGQWFGGDVGLAVLRLAMILMAGATAALIAALLRPYGLVASLVGSMLFATYGWATLYGRTFYLEGFLAFAVVWTFYLLRQVRTNVRSYVVIGVILGIACTIKIWAVVDVAAFAVLIGCVHGRRRLLAWLGGALGTITVVCLPFFLFAPGAMWHNVVVAQLGRTREATAAARLRSFGTLVRLPGTSITPSEPVAMALAAAGLLLALAPLGVQLARRRSLRHWSPAGWWSAIALIQILVLLAAPIFFPHYLLWPIGALALAVGRTVGRLDNRYSRIPLLTGLVVVMAALIAGSSQLARFRYVFPTTSVRSFASEHSCTWFESTSAQSFAATRAVPMWAPCRTWPDPFGATLAFGGTGPRGIPLEERTFPQWNREMRAQISAADSAVTCHKATWPTDAETSAFFAARFVQTGWSSGHLCSFWELRPGVRAAPSG